MKWLSHLRKFLLARLSKWFPGRVDYIGGADILPAPLSREEEEKLVQELRQDDGAIRATLIEHNLRLVAFIARKFENTNVGIEDLISIGTIGLIKAVNTFDPTKKIKLATYASRCIENEILMYLRRNSKSRQDISRDRGGRRPGASARRAEKADRARAADHVPAVRAFGRRMPHAEGGRRRAGNFAELYLAAGKEDIASPPPRNGADDLKRKVQDAEGERGLWPKQRAEGAVRNEQSTGGRVRRLSTEEGSLLGVRGQSPCRPSHTAQPSEEARNVRSERGRADKAAWH